MKNRRKITLGIVAVALMFGSQQVYSIQKQTCDNPYACIGMVIDSGDPILIQMGREMSNLVTDDTAGTGLRLPHVGGGGGGMLGARHGHRQRSGAQGPRSRTQDGDTAALRPAAHHGSSHAALVHLANAGQLGYRASQVAAVGAAANSS